VMLVAQGVQAVLVGEIGFPMVVDEPVLAPRQNAEVVHGLGAPLGMHAVEGEPGIADDVQPVQALGHAQAALIASMSGAWQQFFNRRSKGPDDRRRVIGGHDGGLAQRLS